MRCKNNTIAIGRKTPNAEKNGNGTGAGRAPICVRVKYEKVCRRGTRQCARPVADFFKRGVNASFTRPRQEHSSNQPPVRFWMICIIGRKRAMTIVPTTNAKNTIIIGSMIDVIAPTELSTSSS